MALSTDLYLQRDETFPQPEASSGRAIKNPGGIESRRGFA